MATHPQNVCSLPESIRCYLLRGSTMVPLVPADQLPFQLKGIPRQLSHRQMSDQGWKLFKETMEVPFVLSVQTPTTNDLPSHCSSGKPQYLAPDHRVRAESQNAQTNIHRASQLPQPLLAAVDTAPGSLGPPFTSAIERQPSLADAVASIYPNDAQRLGYTSNTGSESPKKVYCTHWIATGECRWMHTGCKYKHEMPGTEKLRELGFTRGTPKWWKEKNAVSPPKPLTWMQRKMARADDGEQQTGDMPTSRTFPDPLTLRTRKLEERCKDPGNEMQKRNRSSKEEQPTASKQSLPVRPSIRTPPTRSSIQTPNLIDLDDITILPCRPPRSQSTSPALSEASVFSIPQSDISDPLPCSPAPPTRKEKPGKQSRTHTRLPSCTSSSASPSSPPSSSASSDTDTDTDTDPPSTSSKTKHATLSTHQRRKPHSYRKTTNTTSTTAATATSPQPVKTSQSTEPSQLGLSTSKHAVQTPASCSSPPSSSSSKAPQDTHAESSLRKAHRRERRAERQV